MDPRPFLIRHPVFREHATPDGHPERPERLDAIDRALAGLDAEIRDLAPAPASDAAILRVHGNELLGTLLELEGQVAALDADTHLSPRSLEVARLAAGSAVDLGLRVAGGETRAGFALVRPPGHHAERLRSMGFCLINHIAIAAEALRREAGVERIAIVDWDVHHGNGTQQIFESERDVLFISLHQFPFYPGTGALREQGCDAGEGATVNLPLPAGCGDAEYAAAFDGVVLPVLREFQPEIVLVSAGFDAHAQDPLASMEVSGAGFVALATRLRQLADDVCQGRMLLSLEGGYDPEALGEAVAGVVRVLSAPECPAVPPAHGSALAGTLVERFRQAHARHWKSLGPGGAR